jgi:hypothetical protein
MLLAAAKHATRPCDAAVAPPKRGAAASASARGGLPKTMGCLIAVGGQDWVPGNEVVREALIARRAGFRDEVKRRLMRAIDEGELPAELDAAGIATFYTTVLHGLSYQARDGASHATLLAIVRGAMAAWDSLVAAPRDAKPAKRTRKARTGVISASR